MNQGLHSPRKRDKGVRRYHEAVNKSGNGKIIIQTYIDNERKGQYGTNIYC